MVTACVLILVYVAYRFRKVGGLEGGATAIVALLHDMFIVFGVFVLLRIPLNGNFIAAMLTILGYSINDTVVIYDRIRENSALYGKRMARGELVNLSINQSFGSSLMTSITTCVALAIVCVVSIVFNLESIFTFALPLLLVWSAACTARSALPASSGWTGRTTRRLCRARRHKTATGSLIKNRRILQCDALIAVRWIPR